MLKENFHIIKDDFVFIKFKEKGRTMDEFEPTKYEVNLFKAGYKEGYEKGYKEGQIISIQALRKAFSEHALNSFPKWSVMQTLDTIEKSIK